MGQNGRVIIPADIRHALDLKAGDELLVTLEDKRLVLEIEGAQLAQLYRAVGDPPVGELVGEALLCERRDEAGRGDAGR